MPWDQVLHKFKQGSLRSGDKHSGPLVRKRSQAIAIMLSEKRKAEEGDQEYQPVNEASSLGMQKENVVATKKKWIKGAIRHPGALKRAAKRAGRTTRQEADVEKHSSNPKIRSRGNLAETLMGMN